MPDALTIHSGVDSRSGSRVPAAIASAVFALSRRTNSLNATHSSSLLSTAGGCHTPKPVMEVLVVVREAMTGTLPDGFHDRKSQCVDLGSGRGRRSDQSDHLMAFS